MLAALLDILSAYGLTLALLFGWPGLLAGGLVGVGMFPRRRVPGAILGALVGALLWLASWLAVGMSLRMLAVGVA